MTTNKLKPFLLLATGLILGSLLQAQESTNASGGTASGSGGIVTYSVGQVVYTTNSGASGRVNQGVQQPYEIFAVGIKETELNISISVYPNPAVDNLILLISEYNNEKLMYQVWDTQGKLISNGRITEQQTKINTSGLPPAIYLIHIVNPENQKIQSFKIIKN